MVVNPLPHRTQSGSRSRPGLGGGSASLWRRASLGRASGGEPRPARRDLAKIATREHSTVVSVACLLSPMNASIANISRSAPLQLSISSVQAVSPLKAELRVWPPLPSPQSLAAPPSLPWTPPPLPPLLSQLSPPLPSIPAPTPPHFSPQMLDIALLPPPMVLPPSPVVPPLSPVPVLPSPPTLPITSGSPPLPSLPPPLPAPNQPLPPSPPPLTPQLRPTDAAWNGEAAELGARRVSQFMSKLTTTLAPATAVQSAARQQARVVLSSGGAAGGVISEGQGYGLLLAATALATMPLDHAARPAAVTRAYQLFLGWQTMCERTELRRRHRHRQHRRSLQTSCDCSWTGVERANCGGSGDGSTCWRVCCGDVSATSGEEESRSEPTTPGNATQPQPPPPQQQQPAYTSCQRQMAHGCGQRASGGVPSLCLPSWKFNDDVSREVGTGSAPDGDEDAILGSIVLLAATSHGAGLSDDDAPAAVAARPAWWDDVARWTYDSCAAFLLFDTVPHPAARPAANGHARRAVKLGSCWGGWDCANPSYYAPAHYRVFRMFMQANAHLAPPAPPPPPPQSFPPPSSSPPPPSALTVPASATGAGSAETFGTHAAGAWMALIETSYDILNEAQCPESGLVPNWFVPSSGGLDGASAQRARQQWPGWTRARRAARAVAPRRPNLAQRRVVSCGVSR